MACKVINLVGGPGSGKATAADGVFYNLNRLGVNCELVTEWVKDAVWEERNKTIEDQFYLTAKYYHKLWRVSQKVDIIITDSSILAGLFYGEPSQAFKDIVLEKWNEFDNVVYFLNRDDSFYTTTGRMQDLQEAKEVDAKIKTCLDNLGVKYEEISTGSACEYIMRHLIGDEVKGKLK